MSFHYYQKVNMGDLFDAMFVNGDPPDFFADSGAFSAHNVGATISLEVYAGWLHKWRDYFTVYANLDVIGDHAASMRNLRELEKQGLRPLPVFHTHTQDFSVLEALCEEYDYIAIGGMVGYNANTIFPWLVKCHKIARKHDTRLHGFGQTSWKPLIDLPWYSVDSSSWGAGFRYGIVPVFDYRSGKQVKLRLGQPDEWAPYASLIRSYGYDPADFYDRERNTRAVNCGLSMAGYRSLEGWLRKRHGVIPGPTGDGLKIYAADGSADNLRLGAEGIRIYLAEGAAGGKDILMGINNMQEKEEAQ
jgi:hypothetical protein